MTLTIILICLFILVISGFLAGYYSVRKAQMILEDEETIILHSNSLSPKQYGIRYGNGKSRIKKSNRLRYSK